MMMMKRSTTARAAPASSARRGEMSTDATTHARNCPAAYEAMVREHEIVQSARFAIVVRAAAASEMPLDPY